MEWFGYVMEWCGYVIELLKNENIFSTFLRVVLSVVCGGVLGIERGKSNQPAGMRTHMLVCLGAAMAMMTGQFTYNKYGIGDPARLGAQVISGIGFLGAGSIIIEGTTKIRGLTTAAGLWAAACIGLAIGIGFYEGAIISTMTVYLIMTKFRSLSRHFTHNDTWFSLYVEFNSMSAIADLCSVAEAFGVSIVDLQMDNGHTVGHYSVIITAKNPLKKTVDEILNHLKSLDGIEAIRYIF